MPATACFNDIDLANGRGHSRTARGLVRGAAQCTPSELWDLNLYLQGPTVHLPTQCWFARARRIAKKASAIMAALMLSNRLVVGGFCLPRSLKISPRLLQETQITY